MIDKEYIKDNLEKVLIYYGAMPPKNGRGNWACLASRHKNPLNNLSVKNNICCCHCGIKGDVFSVIAEMEGLNYSDKEDFLLILNKASEILNLNESVSPSQKERHNSNKHNNTEEKPENEKYYIDLTNIITQYYNNYSHKINYIYFIKRGLSLEVIKKHKIIIANPKKIFNPEILPKLNNIWAYEYIIPVWKNGIIVNCILRRNDYKSNNNKKTLNLKILRTEFLNYNYLDSNPKYLFICEGWADALTFENLGHKAIAINSIVGISRLIKLVENNINKLKNTIFFVAFDQDENERGQEASKELVKQLKELNLRAFNLNIKKPFKDINEYFIKDKKSFMKSINYLINKIVN